MQNVHKTINTKSRKICSVPECFSYCTPDISLHKFPEEPKLCEQWRVALRIGKPISKYMYVCSKHFVRYDFMPVTSGTIKKRLKKRVVPSKNIPGTKYNIVQKSPDRSNRSPSPIILSSSPTKEREMDQDQIDSVEVYDPVKKCHYRILVPQESERTGKYLQKFSSNSEFAEISENESEINFGEAPVQNWSNIAIWTQNETLALINIFSLHKDKFKDFKRKKGQWNLISKELAKIGIDKAPEKCEIKWKNLLRVYRQHKHDNKGPGKFEFFNELDDIIANDPQFRYIIANAHNSSIKNGKCEESVNINKVIEGKRRKCSCIKSEKQKRHEDRMALMAKKMEIEERKVKAFEDYLKFLKRRSEEI